MTRRLVLLLLGNRLALAGLLVLAVLATVAVVGPWLAPYDPNEVDVPGRLAAPSWSHPFGTDNLGRDVLSRVLVGARVSLQVGFVAVGISLTAGLLIGLVAGFYSGATDALLMRTMDVLFAFPAILLAIAVLAILGPGITNAMIAIGIVYTPIFARIVRAATLVVSAQLYVRAARAVGAGDLRILLRHVLPNIAAPVIVQTSLSLAFAILAEAALSFLGLGVQRPDPAWGRMLAEGRDFVSQAPWMGIFPGLAIFATVLAFNVVGDGLRDALDPRQRSVIESRGRG
ncbi:peptide/nickel transport system permease protein [Micromonospora sp. Llam0]|uniref:ABC transporter permease n=1 Tax=Micromonospora sp. Llam0 TaxID=2485143 RepID=UPI000F4AABD3|nr:ABC transporter permease [Micromonospora sp. Llam0]ROO59246.1 peptide/nickel transport system permease protein [Micromonospora sp. Llam0]